MGTLCALAAPAQAASRWRRYARNGPRPRAIFSSHPQGGEWVGESTLFVRDVLLSATIPTEQLFEPEEECEEEAEGEKRGCTEGEEGGEQEQESTQK